MAARMRGRRNRPGARARPRRHPLGCGRTARRLLAVLPPRRDRPRRRRRLDAPRRARRAPASLRPRQPSKPALYYDGDFKLLAISRNREVLAEAFRFVLPEATLVEDLLDKARFQSLAERVGLPVPRSAHAVPSAGPPSIDLRFPLVIKQLTRQNVRGARWPGPRRSRSPAARSWTSSGRGSPPHRSTCSSRS